MFLSGFVVCVVLTRYGWSREGRKDVHTSDTDFRSKTYITSRFNPAHHNQTPPQTATPSPNPKLLDVEAEPQVRIEDYILPAASWTTSCARSGQFPDAGKCLGLVADHRAVFKTAYFIGFI